eukprot:scaffold4623_cov171-Amphora_coffeaeformis.AAC.3
MPEPPFSYRSDNGPHLDLSEIGSTISAEDSKRQDAYNVSRAIQVSMIHVRNAMESGGSSDNSETDMKSVKDLILSQNDTNSQPRTPRVANLSQRFEELCRLMAFHQFLKTGGWLSPADCVAVGATDEEYLAGACMGLCRDLERYAMGRATARDVASVETARDLVNEILDYLMSFDFRNGPLRRKYDGTKYALKTLETLLYELSVTGATLKGNDEMDTEEPQAKRHKVVDTSKPQEALDAIRSRMEHRDELREKLIKKCRDSQKAAKQAIYALHRGDSEKSSKLIQQCEESIQNELLPIVQEEPPLRSGSFANVLEEYAEAKLFHVWLLGKDEETESTKGTLLLPGDFSVHLEPEEYLGGLCDLTGEIGRYAVQRGTLRDYDGVRTCLEANSAVFVAIQTLERAPSGINKKMDQLRRSVEKIERMTYEMSLSKAAGLNINSEVSESIEKADDGE